MTALKTLIFLVLVPGSVLVVIPLWLVLPGDPGHAGFPGSYKSVLALSRNVL